MSACICHTPGNDFKREKKIKFRLFWVICVTKCWFLPWSTNTEKLKSFTLNTAHPRLLSLALALSLILYLDYTTLFQCNHWVSQSKFVFVVVVIAVQCKKCWWQHCYHYRLVDTVVVSESCKAVFKYFFFLLFGLPILALYSQPFLSLRADCNKTTLDKYHNKRIIVDMLLFFF